MTNKNEEKWKKTKVEKKKAWLAKEGELSVDVYQTKDHIVIQTTIAGVTKDDLEIVTEKDMVSIRGERKRLENENIECFFTEECFWGPFCKEIVLPEETDPSQTKATMNQGVLTIKIPRIEKQKQKEINPEEK